MQVDEQFVSFYFELLTIYLCLALLFLDQTVHLMIITVIREYAREAVHEFAVRQS